MSKLFERCFLHNTGTSFIYTLFTHTIMDVAVVYVYRLKWFSKNITLKVLWVRIASEATHFSFSFVGVTFLKISVMSYIYKIHSFY